ncbi:MAG: hypothetical protein AAGJ94_00930 [Pseudomonadota bacterium]
MKTMFVHIGHPKTGTTSIQQTFRHNAARLADEDLFYFSGYGTHHPVAWTFHKTPKPSHNSKLAQRVYRDFVSAARASRCSTGFLSSETLVRLKPDEIANLLNAMKPLAQTIKVLLYVRHPVGFAISSAAQAVRMGQALSHVDVHPRKITLRHMVTKWRDAIGAENLIIRPFDREQLLNGDVVDDVLEQVDRLTVAGALERYRENEGLSVLGVHLLDALNRRSPTGKLPVGWIQRINGIGGPRYRPPLEALLSIEERTRKDLEFLRAEFGLSLPAPPLVEAPKLALCPEEVQSLADLLYPLLEASRGANDPAGIGPRLGPLGWLRARVFGRGDGADDAAPFESLLD